MSELSPDARDLVAQARKQRAELLGPSAAQRAQLREKLTPLWAAQASQPEPAFSWRWKLGSVALIAGLGLLGWLFTQSGSEAGSSPQPSAASTSRAAPAALVQPAGEKLASAPRDAASVQHGQAEPVESHATGAPAPSERCAPGHVLRAGVCARPPSAAPQLSAAAIRKPKRSAPAARETVAAERADKPQPETQDQPAARETFGAGRPDEPQDQPAESDLLAGLDFDAEGPRTAPARSGARRRTQLAATERVARLPLKAAEERTPERTVETDADPAPPSIDGELELLGTAQAALQKQRPSRALSLLQEHAFRFPTGAMVEERMAMQALALCALQRRQAAQTVLSNLEARGPRSQLLPRVRQQCGL